MARTVKERVLATLPANSPSRGWVMFTYVLGTFAAMAEDECGVAHLVIRTWELEGEDPHGVAEAVGFEDLVSTNEGEWDGCKFTEYRFRQNAQ